MYVSNGVLCPRRSDGSSIAVVGVTGAVGKSF